MCVKFMQMICNDNKSSSSPIQNIQVENVLSSWDLIQSTYIIGTIHTTTLLWFSLVNNNTTEYYNDYYYSFNFLITFSSLSK